MIDGIARESWILTSPLSRDPRKVTRKREKGRENGKSDVRLTFSGVFTNLSCSYSLLSAVSAEELKVLRERWLKLGGVGERVSPHVLSRRSYSSDPFCHQVSLTI